MKQVIEVLNSIEDFTSLNIETLLKDWHAFAEFEDDDIFTRLEAISLSL